jgi:very-short-patch-repair endonuclease
MSPHHGHRVKPAIQATARQLRQPQTPAEARLWARLRAQHLGPKFRRQHPIGRFIVDFCCPVQHLIIEIDGDTHEDQQEYDAQRTAWLHEQGYRVIRFTNEDVRERLEGVLEAILLECRG